MKRWFVGVISSLLMVSLLTGCNEQYLSQEDAEKYEGLKEIYLEEMGQPDTTVSSFHIDFNFKSSDPGYGTLQKLDEIQMWLDSSKNMEIVELVGIYNATNDSLSGITVMMRDTDVEHSYKVVLSYSTNNLKYYVSSVRVPSVDGYKSYYIIIYDEIDPTNNSVDVNTLNNESVNSGNVVDDVDTVENSDTVDNIDIDNMTTDNELE